MSEHEQYELTNKKKIVWAVSIAVSFFIGLTIAIVAFAAISTPSQTNIEPIPVSSQSGCAGMDCEETITDEFSWSSSGCAGVASCETDTTVNNDPTSAAVSNSLEQLMETVRKQVEFAEKLAAESQARNPKTIVDNTTYFVGEYK